MRSGDQSLRHLQDYSDTLESLQNSHVSNKLLKVTLVQRRRQTNGKCALREDIVAYKYYYFLWVPQV